MKHLLTLSCASLLTAGSLYAQKALLLQSPNVDVEYQVTCLSPNGQWAAGMVNDGNYRAFRWNLTTGEFIELSPSGSLSFALGVANDGTVAGNFMDSQYLGNGAAISAAGYYRNGKWHHLNSNGLTKPTTDDAGSQANAISPDGNLVGGIALVGGVYAPVVWNITTGERKDYIFKNVEMNNAAKNSAGSISSVTNDGVACGWVYRSTKSNRTPCIWTTPSDTILPAYERIGPYALARSISSDGKKVLAVDRIFDMETRKTTPLAGYNDYLAFEYFCVNTQGTAVGYAQKSLEDVALATVVKDGKAMPLSDLLAKSGVDLSNYPNLIQAVGVSDDEQTYVLMAYDKNQIPRAVAVRLNQNVETPAPVALKAKALDGAGAVELKWNAPLAKADAVKGYDLYRDGTKVNAAPLTDRYYVDTNLANGNYSYTVKALYDGAESEASASATATLAALALQQPENFVAVQQGLNNVRLMWNAPRPSLSAFSYVGSEQEVYSLGGGAYSFENGVRLRASLLSAYAARGEKLTHVCFYPMAKQDKWTINVYDAADDTKPLYSQDIDGSTLNYGVENRIALTTPVDLPAGKDLIIGLGVTVNNTSYSVVGETFGYCEPGYSDLMRRTGADDGEDHFYSLYERAQSSADGATMYESAWPITALFGSADHSDATVKDYRLYVNGQQSQTLDSHDLTLTGVADGDYTYGVTAVNESGTESAQASAQLTVKQNLNVYKPLNVVAEVTGDKLNATWQAPLADSRAILTYATGKVQAGPQSRNFQAKALYDKEVTRTYDGFQIKALRFYPTADAEFTLTLEQDGKTVATADASDYVLNQWNEVALDKPVTLNASSEYGVVLDCYDALDGTAPLALDDTWARRGVSDLFSTDEGNSFSSLVEQGGTNGNWCLGLVVGTDTDQPLPVEGYQVLVDGKQAGEGLVKETAYSQNFSGETNKTHRLQVKTVYAADGSNVAADVVYFTINPTTGIEGVTTDATLHVTQGTTALRVEDVSVKQLRLYAADGTLAAESDAATLPITSLAKGVYVLAIHTTDGRSFTQKVQL